MKSDLSCSQLLRVFLCPASVRMSRVSPVPPVKPAASEGIMLHDVLDGKNPSQPLTDEQQRCIDFVNSQTNELVKRVFADKTPTIEREVDFMRDGKYWGRCDFLAHRCGTILIVDPKFGREPVSAANANWQLKGYVVGARDHVIVNRAYAAIIQPRVPKENQVTVVEFDSKDIDRTDWEIARIIAAAEEQDSQFKPSEEACKYCPANQSDPLTGKPICPAMESHFKMMRVSKLSASELTDPKQMATYLEAARMVSKMCESIEYHAMEMAKKLGGLPGFKLKDGRRIRKITDANSCYTALSGRIKPEEFTKACKVQIGELEEVFKASTGLKGLRAKTELEHTLIDAKCLEITNGNQSLVNEKEEPK